MDRYRTGEKGFTLVEVLIAITILLIGALAIVPLFVLVGETAEINNRKTVAANLANAEMEYIRSLEFNEVGITGGNPSGVLEAFDQENIDGVIYNISRTVSWEAEAADCTSDEDGQILWDYKSVRVEVTTDAPGRPGAIRQEMETLLSRSIFQEPSPKNGIRICAFRGWKNKNEPVGGVKVTITGPGRSKATQWTTSNSKGAALFFLPANKTGEYLVEVEAPVSMMVLPDQESFRLTVPKNGWGKKQVYVEYPCYIAVELKDILTGARITQPGALVLESQFNPEGRKTLFSSSPISEEVLGPLWPLGSGYPPGYNLVVQDVEGYHDSDWNYYEPQTADGESWDGTFPAPGTHLTLTVPLVPVPATSELAVDAFELDWLDSVDYVIAPDLIASALDEDNILLPVKFGSVNHQHVIKLTTGKTELTASAMYFEVGLALSGGDLRLNSGLIKFSYPVSFSTQNPYEQGRLVLGVPVTAGFGLDGQYIQGGEPGIPYGEVHFVDGLFNGETDDADNLLVKGAFYYPHDILLPDEVNRLIPWHKLD